MAIVNYGLFWQREEVNWKPGQGGQFRLLGRNGVNKPGLRVADFREQTGVYILYGNYGVFRVGIVTESRLGIRLRDHHTNYSEHEWDRFSWFGFRAVDWSPDETGVCGLNDTRYLDAEAWIRDIESLLIRAMGPTGQRIENFRYEERWEQVPESDAVYWLNKVRPAGDD
ncbi:GIY-YIG nuclease family protein [Urbifossiella limnaea]|uniref:Uncharacterized protein n=1 Tax=Urbifossiella limnaea TaxID=2528023 RepID=A0A517Y0L4_9BACT|nr:GIY-YIG nuclease family protein [Urbifossiella limnaea]QDU23302.1 hypothetical protein ETAA1_52970 [Urbifossiella limnaea]